MNAPMPVHYLLGDATAPKGTGSKIIAHVCNDIGAWGAGFVLAVSKRWPETRLAYLKDRDAKQLQLGTVRLVPVGNDIWVANMVAQRGIRVQDGVPPIRYDALAQCLRSVAAEAERLKATIHMPRIGRGLAGGRWDLVEPLIHEACRNTEVFVYDLAR
jgi:O-acetyl-ADP-ribose deacetylase (regulator of RNase III)